MKNIKAGLWAIAALVALCLPAKADWSSGMWILRGQYPAMRDITISSTALTAILPADVFRADAVCYNNSAYTLWLGSATANAASSVIAAGFPVVAYSYFKLDGAFPGLFYGVADTGVSTIDVRCLDGKTYQ